jgi:hypothetical protein
MYTIWIFFTTISYIALTVTLSDNTWDDRLMDAMKACLRVVVLDTCCEEREEERINK